MKFSLNWLAEYSKEPFPSIEILEEVVTSNAFEIEEATPKANDVILDIKVLPNRAHDALGHRGMARDICALVGTTFTDPNDYYSGSADTEIAAPAIAIQNNEACTRFMSVRIDNISVSDSPEWLKVRLNAIGQKSINSIVDATNYVQFSINKPMHAYDSALIAEGKLSARFAQEGEKLTTLDDKELILDGQTLVIADAEKPLGLAGIKGGKFSGISPATTSITLESANFNPTLIRKTSQKYGIRTDASKRFENEISDSLVEEGLRMTIALIQKINPDAKVGDIVDVYPHPKISTPVTVSLSQINNFLGTTYTTDDVLGVFSKLMFSVEVSGEAFTVTAPSDRLDIVIKEDLIEEVARVKGLANIKGVLPHIARIGIPYKRLYYENKIKNILHAHSFSEIMTYSFGDTGEVEIVKGLASDKEKLRSKLAVGVENAFAKNMLNAPLLNLQVIKMYEFGNVFTQGGERRHFALVIDDGKKKSLFTEEVEMLLSQIKRDLGVKEVMYETANSKPYVIELDFDALIDTLPEPTSYEPLDTDQSLRAYAPISPYPFIVRDIAVWVPASVTWEDIHTLALQIDSPHIVRIDCFDTFSKEVDGVQKVSFAFRIVLQSKVETLTDMQANEIAEKMYTLLKAQGYEVR